MRKTKIIATIGPASDNEDIFRELCKAGLNVARLNFSHGTHEGHKKTIDMIKKVRAELGLPIAILLDTKGPEYRTGLLKNGSAELKTGAAFTFTTRDIEGDDTIVSVSYKNLNRELAPGDVITVNNGLVFFRVETVENTEIHCTVTTGGELKDRKSMSFPGKVLKQKYLSEQDKSDLLFGIENGIDFVAASFVSCKQDMVDLKEFMDANGGADIDLIAKIENRSGVDNIDDILTVCQGIMVARGDLGVEVPCAEVPAIQKALISRCCQFGRRVITATEMLESMIYQPRPTRAEISDVANAVYDGTSAIMLSGETAAGKYPVEALKMMSEIAEEAESHINYIERYVSSDFIVKDTMDALSHATCGIAMDILAKAIAVSSISGMTVRMISRFRPSMDIIGLATNERVYYKLAMSWGVIPVISEQFDSTDVLFYHAKQTAKEILRLQPGDLLVVTGGKNTMDAGSTDTIKIETIK